MAACCDFTSDTVRISFLLYKIVTNQYKDPAVLSSVRRLVPEDTLDGSIESLLKWFKGFMRWMPAQPVCNCNGSDRFMQKKVESGDARIHRTEVYTCDKCGAIQRFPRYTEILHVAESRVGRCSEWSMLFGAILNSLSFQSRIVHDYLDHCWNEVLLDGRWIHVDSTLDYPLSLDHPYFYEQNWKKRYLYVLAFSSDKIEDVTQKYTQQWMNIISRRQELQNASNDYISVLQNLYSSIQLPY